MPRLVRYLAGYQVTGNILFIQPKLAGVPAANVKFCDVMQPIQQGVNFAARQGVCGNGKLLRLFVPRKQRNAAAAAVRESRLVIIPSKITKRTFFSVKPFAVKLDSFARAVFINNHTKPPSKPRRIVRPNSRSFRTITASPIPARSRAATILSDSLRIALSDRLKL